MLHEISLLDRYKYFLLAFVRRSFWFVLIAVSSYSTIIGQSVELFLTCGEGAPIPYAALLPLDSNRQALVASVGGMVQVAPHSQWIIKSLGYFDTIVRIPDVADYTLRLRKVAYDLPAAVVQSRGDEASFHCGADVSRYLTTSQAKRLQQSGYLEIAQLISVEDYDNLEITTLRVWSHFKRSLEGYIVAYSASCDSSQSCTTITPPYAFSAKVKPKKWVNIIERGDALSLSLEPATREVYVSVVLYLDRSRASSVDQSQFEGSDDGAIEKLSKQALLLGAMSCDQTQTSAWIRFSPVESWFPFSGEGELVFQLEGHGFN